jgi:hypothetical protein
MRARRSFPRLGLAVAVVAVGLLPGALLPDALLPDADVDDVTPGRAFQEDRPPTQEAAPAPREDAGWDPDPVPAEVERPLATAHAPDGFLVALGAGPIVGDGGRLTTYTVEVDPGLDVDLGAFVATVRAALEDPDRGWTARGEHRLQWVADSDQADVRVVLAAPDVVDAFCARNGLDTNGIFSCWDGQRAMLNHWRWEHGARAFGDDLHTYRIYLVNHEVGHGLGLGHVGCRRAGSLAPVMMQQTRTVERCEPNGWPHP